MGSLQDQLLKAGATSKQKARQATLDNKKKNKQNRHNIKHKIETEDSLKKEVEQAKINKQVQNKRLAEQEKAKREQKEARARVKQILEHNGLKDYEGEISYNFTYEKLVKRLHVNESVHRSLINGTLAICIQEERFFVLPEGIANKLLELDPSVIAALNEKKADQAVDENDPYADFEIPDDLMW